MPTIGAVMKGLERVHATTTWAMLMPRFSAIVAILYETQYAENTLGWHFSSLLVDGNGRFVLKRIDVLPLVETVKNVRQCHPLASTLRDSLVGLLSQ